MPVGNSVRRVLFLLLTAALMLTACNMGATPAPTIDVNAINTAAFNTAMAQVSLGQTQAALAAPSATIAPTNTATTPLATVVVPGAGTALPTAAGALPTLSFNTTPTTPLAGFTQLATQPPPTSAGIGITANGCNDALFVAEDLPDKSEIGAGKKFAKSWEIKNTGTCTWDEGYTFAFQANLSSPEITGYDIVIDKSEEFTKPGHSQSFIVKLTAPSKGGEYKGYWKLRDDAGNYFGPLVFFDIIVK